MPTVNFAKMTLKELQEYRDQYLENNNVQLGLTHVNEAIERKKADIQGRVTTIVSICSAIVSIAAVIVAAVKS